jgi:hypothetical protein
MKQFLATFFAVLAALLVVGAGYLVFHEHKVQDLGAINIQRAQQYWGKQACNGSILVTKGNLPGDQAGLAQYDKLTLPTGQVIQQNCHITVDTRHFPNRVYCGIIIHEYGHLLGHDHVDNPRSIMYPRINRSNLPPVCKRL